MTQIQHHRLSHEHLTALLQLFRRQQSMIAALTANTAPASPTPSPQQFSTSSHKPPEYYNNAKYEDIISKPIKPLYDGSSEQLVPFLNRLEIWRQDEGLYPITFLDIHNTKYDLIRHFAKIDELVMLQEAKLRWTSPTISSDKHTIDHPTFNARVLACLLLGSITDDFCITIINRIPQEYRNDGPLLLWTICNNIHRNNIAFVESIKCKICDSTLSQFNGDISKYIFHTKDNLCLIMTSDASTPTHTDLLIYLFTQLQLCKVPLFKEAVDARHIAYLEAKLPGLTPEKLLKMTDDKIQILKHADQWKESDVPDIMALKMELEKQKRDSDTLVCNLVAHVSQITNDNRQNQNYNGQKHPHYGHHQGNKQPN